MPGQTSPDLRCVAVVDESLPPGLAANAVGVLALTLGARVPSLVGADFVDGNGQIHRGLIPVGLPVLATRQETLKVLWQAAHAAGADVVDFPTAGQRTNDYDEFRRRVAATDQTAIDYLGLIVYGPQRVVRKLTGQLPLLR